MVKLGKQPTRKGQSDPDDWLGWAFIGLGLMVLGLILWKAGPWVAATLALVAAFWWWAARVANRVPRTRSRARGRRR